MVDDDRRGLWLLFFCLVCVGIGQAMLFVILPPAAREIGLSPFQVSMIFATSASVWVFMSPMWGRRSDVIGRRPVLLIGLLGFAASMILLATTIGLSLDGYFTPMVAFGLMVASRCVFAVFGSGTPPASQAYVADRTSREERTRGVALINAAFGTGQTLGPAVGAGLATFGLLAPLYLSAGLAIFSAVVIWLFLPEKEKPVVVVPKDGKKLRFTDARIVPFVVIAICMQAVRATTTITLAFFLQDMLALSPTRTMELAGIGFMILAIAGLGAQLGLVQRLRIRPATLIQTGLGSGVLAFGLFNLELGFAGYAVALAFLGMGLGLVRPGNAAGASLSVAPEEQGAVAGITSAIGVVGNIFGPLLGTALYEWSPRGPYLLNGVLMAAALVFSLTHPGLRRARA
ncbi:MAG: MFS transporter [Candidatus Binatia bacterium]|nr:MFS transporter [Candidatus Binatia bacterium]